MNREIIFRAWTGLGMEYEVGASQHGYFYCTLDPRDSACLITTFYPKETPVMQFTGLKDKNGKEIYEGDVVKYLGVSEKECFGEIIFRKGSFITQADKISFPIMNVGEQLEVIGNIYENSELLTNP